MEILLLDTDYCDACKWVFLPSFLSVFLSRHCDWSCMREEGGGSMGSRGATCTCQAMRKVDRLHENHSAEFWIWWVEYQSILIMVKEHFCGTQCFEPIEKVAIF